MNNLELVDLIEDIKSQKDITSEMLGRLTDLTLVLRDLYKVQREIKEYSKKVEEYNMIQDIQAINDNATKCMEDINKISEVTATTIEGINKKVRSISNKLEYLENVFGKFNNNIEVFENKINDIQVMTDRILWNTNNLASKNILESINELLVQIEQKYNTMQNTSEKYNEYIEKFMSISANNEVVANKIEKNLAKMEQRIKEQNNAMIEREKNIEKEIIKSLDFSQSIYEVFKLIEKRNSDSLKAFSALANKWADENIHGIALKKKK